jgi:hypothetical protein
MTARNYREPLPKMGALCVQWVRCGRPGCGCSSGRQLHGPYHYFFYRECGRLRKRYVRMADVEAVEVAVAAAHARHRVRWSAQQASQAEWRTAVERLREVENYVRARDDADCRPEPGAG